MLKDYYTELKHNSVIMALTVKISKNVKDFVRKWILIKTIILFFTAQMPNNLSRKNKLFNNQDLEKKYEATAGRNS